MKKILILILFIIISIPGYTAEEEDENKLYDSGFETGSEKGEVDGKLEGEADYKDGKKNDWEESIDDKNELYDYYDIGHLDYQYRKGFFAGYEENFESSYIDAYIESLTEDINKKDKSQTEEEVEKNSYGLDYSEGILQGEQFATIIASKNAYDEYKAGLDNNFSRTIDEDYELVTRYNLEIDTEEFKQGFIDGYKEKYKEQYKDTFRQLNADKLLESVSENNIVSMDEITVTSDDQRVTFEIDKGTLFLENTITIEKEKELLEGFKQLTNIYKINVNDGKGAHFYKKAKVKFKYYGPENAGIYKIENGKVIYQETKKEEGYLNLDIESGQYNGGRYVILLDKKIYISKENKWIESDIKFLIKRNILSSDLDISGQMTRGNFFIILDKLYNLENHDALKVLPEITIESFKDKNSIPEYAKDSLNRLLTLNYLNGYTDKTLKVNKPITYREIEYMMRKISLDKDFDWTNIQKEIIEEKGILPSLVDKNTPAKATEIVYMLRKYVE